MRYFILLLLCFFPTFSFSTELVLSARLVSDGAEIQRGIKWRILQEVDGKIHKVDSLDGGTVEFDLPSGSYIIHAAFGRADVMKEIILSSHRLREEFVFDAGGVKLTALAGDKEISGSDLSFTIYEKEIDENGERRLIAEDIKAHEILRLKTGTYHIVSEYGGLNASASVDLDVRAGQVTDATLQHRAGRVSMRLVSQSGGAAIANTTWSILTEQGRKVYDSALVSPDVILAEGKYEVSVRHGEGTYGREFEVETGGNHDIEVFITN